MECDADILVPIPDEDLPKLSAIYKKETDWAPHTYSLINTVIKWRQNNKPRDLATILSPNNCWEQNGAFIVIFKIPFYHIFICTLEQSCDTLFEGLNKTNLIPYDGNVHTLFYCLHYKHYPAVEKLIKEKQLYLKFNIPCNAWSISKEEALQFTFECPPDVYVKELNESYAEKINSLWPHREEKSELYLANLISLNGGYGLFLRSTNELVAWVMKTQLGQLGMLETVKQHKKKGYGSFLTKLMSKEIAQEGHSPYGTVVVGNVASEKMFDKLKFQKLHLCYYLGVLSVQPEK